MPREPRHIATAKDFGLIHDGWTLEDYCRHAIDNMGYETICIHGRQGSGKSNFALQIAHWIYGDWDTVLDNIVFTPESFVSKLKNLKKGERIPVLIFDDVGVSFPSATFRTDPLTYQDLDSTWAAIRTKATVVVLTIPLIDRLSKNIRDNVSVELFTGRNRKYVVERIVRLPNIKSSMMTNLFKILVEKGQLDIYKVPTPVFKRYWSKRLDLTEKALAKMERNVELDNPEGYTKIIDLAEELGLSPNTIQQMCSRGVVIGQKINGLFYIKDEYIPQLKRIYENKGAFKYRAH